MGVTEELENGFKATELRELCDLFGLKYAGSDTKHILANRIIEALNSIGRDVAVDHFSGKAWPSEHMTFARFERFMMANLDAILLLVEQRFRLKQQRPRFRTLIHLCRYLNPLQKNPCNDIRIQCNLLNKLGLSNPMQNWGSTPKPWVRI